MIVTKTPFRMSFFGGGTDMKEYFEENGGAVLSTTIDKYCYVNTRYLPPFFDYSTELSYSKIERVKKRDDIEHPAIRNAMKMLDIDNIRLTYEADLPARSGLGTSSSFAAGMLLAFCAMKGYHVSKKTLATMAIDLERTLCKEAGGWQDQIAAVYGGLNKITFDKNGFEVIPIKITEERKMLLSKNLLLFFTGFTRFSSDIQKQNNTVLTDDKKAVLKKMHEMVDEAEKILTDEQRNLDEFGLLLNESWNLKKRTGSKISTNTIDELYRRGIEAGALGGKLLGAGGGGFLLFYVKDDQKDNVLHAMKDLLYVPFSFSNVGSDIIYPLDGCKNIIGE